MGAASTQEFKIDDWLELIHVSANEEEPYWELDLEADLIKAGEISEDQAIEHPSADLPPASRHMNWSESMTIMWQMKSR